LEWRRLHKDEIYGLYSSPNILPMIKTKRDVQGMWQAGTVREKSGTHVVLVGKPEGEIDTACKTYI
jgi:hypothetical protein